MLRSRYRTHLSSREIAQWSIFKMAPAAILNFEKNGCQFITVWPIFTKFGGHVATAIQNAPVWSENCTTDAILDPEEVLLSNYYLTNPRQIWWYWCHSDVEHICHVEKREVIEVQDGGCHHLVFWKTIAVYSIFDYFSPNMVGMLWIRLITHLWCRKIELEPQSEVAASAILDFDKLLPFLHLLTKPHQTWSNFWESD